MFDIMYVIVYNYIVKTKRK